MSIRLESSPSLTFLDAFPARDRKAAEAAIAEHRDRALEIAGTGETA